MLEDLHPVGRANAGGRDMVLDRDRQTFERPRVARIRQSAIGFLGFLERTLLDQSDDRVDLVIERLDSLEERGDQLSGRDFASPQQADETAGGRETEVVHDWQ